MPANEYYDSTGAPSTGANISSSTLRAEFDAIQDAFAKLPALSGNDEYVVRVNETGTALEAVPFSTLLAASAPSTKTSNVTIGASERYIINNKSGSSLTVTMPDATTSAGREITFKNLQAYTVISATSNVAPLGSTVAGTAILPATVGAWATLVSDGTTWVIMAEGA